MGVETVNHNCREFPTEEGYLKSPKRSFHWNYRELKVSEIFYIPFKKLDIHSSASAGRDALWQASLHSCLRPEACVIDRKTTKSYSGTLVIRSSDNPAIRIVRRSFWGGERKKNWSSILGRKVGLLRKKSIRNQPNVLGVFGALKTEDILPEPGGATEPSKMKVWFSDSKFLADEKTTEDRRFWNL